jgi:hypothetical protein
MTSVFAAIALAAQVTLASQVSRPDDRAELQKIQQDLRQVEEQIELLRRTTPPEFDQVEEEKSLRKIAGAAKVSNLKIRFLEEVSRLPLEGGTASPMELHAVELSGRDLFQNVYLLLSMLDHRPRFSRLETLRLDAADSDTVRFSARLALPVLTDDPQPEPSLRGGILAAARDQLARKRAIVSALAQYLDPAQQQHVPEALANLEDEIGTGPIALIGTGFDGTNITLRGVLVGTAARTALKDSLKKTRMRTIREEFTKSGICLAFTITARPEPGDRPPKAVIDNGMFDAGTSAVCKPELAPVAAPVVAGSSLPEAPPPFLQLRGVDLADVFAALADLLPEAFVVDQDVAGRIRLDVFDNASLDDVFREMGSAGVRIGPGPVHHVSRVSRSETPNATGTKNPGSPVSFTIKDAAIAEVLCLFGEITGQEINIPRDQQGRVSIFAIDAPVNHLLDVVIESGNLTSVSEGKRLVLRDRGDARDVAGANACGMRPASSPSRLAQLPASVRELGTADIELVGLARLSDSWRAYVYGPARRLMSLETGNELLDARVKSVGPDGVTLTTNGGKVVTIALRR